jgi:hypothetical protein
MAPVTLPRLSVPIGATCSDRREVWLRARASLAAGEAQPVETGCYAGEQNEKASRIIIGIPSTIVLLKTAGT